MPFKGFDWKGLRPDAFSVAYVKLLTSICELLVWTEWVVDSKVWNGLKSPNIGIQTLEWFANGLVRKLVNPN